MARWKLMTSHYLNTPGSEWEYNEVRGGETKRLRLPVPKHFDINDPKCWTNRWGNKDNEEGEIIVCHEGKGERGDAVFTTSSADGNIIPGTPSPDMQPVDDEAKAISAKLSPLWAMRPEMQPGEFNQSLIDKFQADIADAQAKPVEIPGMNDLVASMQALVVALAPKTAEPTRRA